MRTEWPCRSPKVASAVIAFNFLLVGCGLFEDVLPTSQDGSTTTSVGSSSSGATGASPSKPTTYPSTTTGVTAPEIQSPTPGTQVSQAQPVLVVGNASTKDEDPITYAFEVSQDEAFTKMVATVHGIDQGRAGRTAWQVSQPLELGKYFWRSRARSGLVKGPYSSVAQFTVVASGPSPGPDVAVVDPLTNGASVGEVHGGNFTTQGWQVASQSDYIRYEIPTLNDGFVEWENRGLRPTNPASDQYMLFGMWDPTRGDYRTNPFRVHIQKLDRNNNAPYIRLRWISAGEQIDAGYNFLDWDPLHTYRWRIAWGPAASAYQVRVFLDGQLIINKAYTRDYAPVEHWVEMGIAERAESIVGTVYANVRIGKN